MKEVKLDASSKIKATFFTNEPGTILLSQYVGEFGIGTKGNCDGIFIFAKLAEYYFAFEPVTVIIDLADLKYQFGNTMLKVINFFFEIGRDKDEISKKVIIVWSNENKAGLQNLESIIKDGSRIYFETLEEAFAFAETETRLYLK